MPDHRAIGDIECGQERARAVVPIVVGEGARPPFLHRQSRLGAIRRLPLTLLPAACGRLARSARFIAAEGSRCGRSLKGADRSRAPSPGDSSAWLPQAAGALSGAPPATRSPVDKSVSRLAPAARRILRKARPALSDQAAAPPGCFLFGDAKAKPNFTIVLPVRRQHYHERALREPRGLVPDGDSTLLQPVPTCGALSLVLSAYKHPSCS